MEAKCNDMKKGAGLGSVCDLGWSPSLSLAEVAPTPWPAAAPSATSHFHSSPFSEGARDRHEGKKGKECIYMHPTLSYVCNYVINSFISTCF